MLQTLLDHNGNTTTNRQKAEDTVGVVQSLTSVAAMMT